MSIELVMPSSHVIHCCPLLLLPPIPPSIRVFSNESSLIIPGTLLLLWTLPSRAFWYKWSQISLITDIHLLEGSQLLSNEPKPNMLSYPVKFVVKSSQTHGKWAQGSRGGLGVLFEVTLNTLSCGVMKASSSVRKNEVASLLGWVSLVVGIWSWDLWCLFNPCSCHCVATC